MKNTKDCFEHLGFKCEIIEIDFGILVIPPYHNGYVILEKGHPWFEKDYNTLEDIGVEAHGGLTYSEAEPDGTWKIGFDTNHYYDDLYTKSKEFVRKETIKLAEQAYNAMTVSTHIPDFVRNKVEELKKLGYTDVRVEYNDTIAEMYSHLPHSGWSVTYSAWMASYLGGRSPYDSLWHSASNFPTKEAAESWIPKKRLFDGLDYAPCDIEIRQRSERIHF